MPEFTITTRILASIGKAEYSRAIVENTPVLQTWQAQLTKDTKIEAVFAGLQTEGINIGYENVKKVVQGLKSDKNSLELNNFSASYDLVNELASNKDLRESDIKFLAKTVLEGIIPRTRQTGYRSILKPNKTKPEEVLAELTEFIDWLNTREAREEHPIIIAGITKFTLMAIFPFEEHNMWLSSLISLLVLKMNNYGYKNWISLEDGFFKDYDEINKITNEYTSSKDYTPALEYICEQYADRSLDLAEKIKLLAKDSKIAKASGRARLTERQEKIVEYLQDYGLIQNKDFPILFPKISEDSVLRDLKVLLDMGLIVKSGSTKSSRYELK